MMDIEDPIDICEKLRKRLCELPYAPVSLKAIEGYDETTIEQVITVAKQRAINEVEYDKVATRLRLQKIYLGNRKCSFSEFVKALRHRYTTKFLRFVEEHAADLDNEIYVTQLLDYDYLDIFGMETLLKGYLMRSSTPVSRSEEAEGATSMCELPCFLMMRCAIVCSMERLTDDVLQLTKHTYELLVKRRATFATPVMFNAGANKNANLASCYLVAMTPSEDSIDGVFSTLHKCALISAMSGGLGVSMHDVQARGSPINNGEGTSQGLLPVMRQFNEMARTVDQGGGKRRGSCAVYLEPWHADLCAFLDARITHGQFEQRTHDLFLALWVPDLFMQRVHDNKLWSFFCPKKCPGLANVWGDEFVKLYKKYEDERLFERQLPARDVFSRVLITQANTGQPYMMYKDSANRKSNHQHRGTIRSSNLCAEIIQYTASDETAVCNLGSLSLPAFVDEGGFDFKELWMTAHHFSQQLDSLIDATEYPTEAARKSNMLMRPIGLGVSGLWDVFAELDLVFGSPEAVELDRQIFACIYHACITASVELAASFGAYPKHLGSPADRNQLQPDMWDVETLHEQSFADGFSIDWRKLRHNLATTGLRNSLSIAIMPTASTAQIMGNTESIEPPTALIMVRRVISGDHVVTNKVLRRKLLKRGLWTPELVKRIIADHGSVQNIDELADHDKHVFRNAWEIQQKSIVDHAAARGPYVCQGMSMNIHLADASEGKLTALHFATWKAGLKTGSYYIRTSDPSRPVPVTVDRECLSCSA